MAFFVLDNYVFGIMCMIKIYFFKSGARHPRMVHGLSCIPAARLARRLLQKKKEYMPKTRGNDGVPDGGVGGRQMYPDMIRIGLADTAAVHAACCAEPAAKPC